MVGTSEVTADAQGAAVCCEAHTRISTESNVCLLNATRDERSRGATRVHSLEGRLKNGQ